MEASQALPALVQARADQALKRIVTSPRSASHASRLKLSGITTGIEPASRAVPRARVGESPVQPWILF